MTSEGIDDEKLSIDSKSEGLIGITYSDGGGCDKEPRNDDDDVAFGDKETLENETESTVHKKYPIRIRLLARVQMLVAIVSIILSSVVLACGPCGTKGTSAGSGVWCPIFFLMLGAMCHSVKEKINPSKIICIFGTTAAYFALLMFAIETLEVTLALKEDPFHVAAVALHVVLCVNAAVEFFLIIAMICLHMVPRRDIKETYNALKTSADDFLMPSVLKTKKTQTV